MRLRNRVAINLASGFFVCCLLIPTSVVAQYRESPAGARPVQRGNPEEVYQESALRRFEIVTLISLPFTAIHSFLVVRGVEMVRQNEIAPELSSTNFKVIGASAVSFALFIGFWDWLHTHDIDSSEQLIPASPSAPSPQQRRRKVGGASWNVEEASSSMLPILQVRF